MPLSDKEELELLRLRKQRAALQALRNPRELDFERLKLEKEYNPTNDMGAVKRSLAAAGKAVSDTWLGAKQRTGFASQDEVDESKRLDAPLMYTPGGKVGNMSGNAALTVLPGTSLSAAGAVAKSPGMVQAGRLFTTAPANVPGLISNAGLGAVQGLLQPTATGESTVTNTLLGAGAGATIPAMGMTGKGAAAAFEPLFESGRDKILGRVLNNAAGTGAPQAKANLHAGGILVPGSEPTAAEVANSGGIAAVQRAASAVDPESYAARGQAQNQARVAALDNIIGPPGRMETAVKDRAEQTKVLRDQALKNADYGTTKTQQLEGLFSQKNDAAISALQDKGKFQTFAAQQGALADNFTPVPGMPRVSGRYSANAERVPEGLLAAGEASQIETQRKAERDFVGYQLESLKQSGYSPLSSKGITDSLSAVLSKPGNNASDVVQKTVGEVREKLASLADKSGNLKAADLYTVRKELGDVISKYAKENQNWDKRFTAGLTKDIQSGIDEAITKAGGGDLWKQYLTKYQELSKPVNKIEVVKEIKDKSTRPLDGLLMPNQYARSLSDETAQAATGFDKATLANTLDPQTLDTLMAVRKDLARSEQAKNLGRGPGSDTVQKLAATNLMERSGMPWMINFPGMGRMGSWAYKEADDKMKAELAEALLNPQQAALLMDKATPSQREKILSGILRIGGGPLTLGAALTYSGASK